MSASQIPLAAESLPLSQRNWTARFTNKPIEGNDIAGIVEAEPTVYSVSAPAVALLGLTLTAGRDLSPSAFVPMGAADDYSGLYKAGEVVISEALAHHLFPEGHAVGKSIYADAQHPLQVVGVVRTLTRPALRTDGDNDMSLILPLVPDGTRVMYALRSDDDRIEAVVSAGEAALTTREPQRMVPRSITFDGLRADYFRHGQTMAVMFLCSGLALLLVTATGVYGLASFWVRRRYRQIGIRRALGARRIDIVSYFLLENLILTVTGSLVGSALAVGLNLAIARYYEVARIEPIYLVTGVVAVLLIGQIAVLVPANKAAKEVPVAILRST
jgi:putative ABC transport system permease protein